MSNSNNSRTIYAEEYHADRRLYLWEESGKIVIRD